MNTTTVAVLPIGEFENEPVRSAFDAILRAFEGLKADLTVADPARDEAGARLSVQELCEKNPDLLLLIALRGLSAQALEAAALASPVPCLLWPVAGRFALPSSALARGALHEARIPVELLYGAPEHPDSIDRLRCIMGAARAFSKLRRSRIGVVGGLFPNLVSCRYDPDKVRARLGTTIVPISFDEMRSRMRTPSRPPSEIEQARRELALSHRMDAGDEKAAEAGLQLHLGLQQVARERNLDGFATECWSGFPRELGLNPCMGFVDDSYMLACEGDVLLGVSLLMVRALTGSPAYVGDLYELEADGLLTLTHCGAPASLAGGQREIVLGKSQLGLERGFETLTCRPRLQNGPVTVFRFYGSGCDQMHLAMGDLQDSELSPNLTVKVRLAGSRADFLEQCFGNHYLVVAGDIRAELKLLGKWLDITISET